MSNAVSRGDRYDIPFAVNGDLTGATTRLLARRMGGVTIELDHQVTDPVNGAGVLTDTSELPVGPYRMELEATNGTQIITYPMPALFSVSMDLG